MYQKGYFHQYLNPDGWQQESTPENDFYNMPVQLVRDDAENPLKIAVEYPGRNVTAQIWKARIGRISLYLLDTNVTENSKEDQNIGEQLYGGDNDGLVGFTNIRLYPTLELYASANFSRYRIQDMQEELSYQII